MSNLQSYLASWLNCYAQEFGDEDAQKTSAQLQNPTALRLFDLIDCLRNGKFLCRILQAMDNSLAPEIADKYIYRYRNNARERVALYNIRYALESKRRPFSTTLYDYITNGMVIYKNKYEYDLI